MRKKKQKKEKRMPGIQRKAKEVLGLDRRQRLGEEGQGSSREIQAEVGEVFEDKQKNI